MDQEILDMLYDYDREFDLYKRGDKNGRFHQFFGKKNINDHRILPTTDGSVVVGPRGDFLSNNTYLVKYPNNGFYIGPLNGQFRHGFGYRSYADPELVYAGEYNNNQKSGKGKLWARKDKRWVYDGNWANDTKTGYGEMWKQGVIYKGNWLNDKLDGIGRMDWPSGQSYEGSFSHDLRNGEGTMTFPNGDQYVGSWLNGRPHGKGLYQWRSGETYQGTWQNGVMDGSGEIEYGIPVKGLGSMRMGSVQELNYQLQRPDDWNAEVMKSSQFIRSYRESIIPESVKRQLKPEMTSSVGQAGFGGKPAPTNLNFSYADTRPLVANNAAPGTYNVSTTGGFNPASGSTNFVNESLPPFTQPTVLPPYTQPLPQIISTVAPVYAEEHYLEAKGYSTNNVAPAYTQAGVSQIDSIPSSKTGLASNVIQTGAGTDKIDTRAQLLKTEPTGAYTNNPLNYVNARAAARSHMDKGADGASYTITTDPQHGKRVPVVSTVTNTYAPGHELPVGKESSHQKSRDNSYHKDKDIKEGSHNKDRIYKDSYQPNTNTSAALNPVAVNPASGYQEYKVTTTTTTTNPNNNYNYPVPGHTDFSSGNNGNLRITRDDVKLDSYPHNGTKAFSALDSSQVRRTELNNGGDTRFVTRIN